MPELPGKILPKGRREELLEKLEERDIQPRITFPFFVGERRKKAVKTLAGEREPTEDLVGDLMESDDRIEKKAGFYLLPEVDMSPEEVRDYAEELEDYSGEAQEEAGKTRIKLLQKLPEEESFKELKKSLEKGNEIEAEQAARSLIHYGEKGFKELRKVAEGKKVFSSEKAAKIGAAEALAGFEKDGAAALLKEMARNSSEHSEVRKEAAKQLGNYSENTKSVLADLSTKLDEEVKEGARKGKMNAIMQLSDDKAIQELERKIEEGNLAEKKEAAETIIQYGEDALPYLEDLVKYSSNSRVKSLAKKSMNFINAEEEYRELLWNQKPLFATPFTDKLAERTKKLQEISSELQEEFQEDFTGITIFGSTSKGYLNPESDLDYAVISDDEDAVDKFQDLADEKDLDLCEGFYMKKEKGEERQPNHLFSGLFFGDHDELMELQKETLQEMDEEEWEEVRRNIEQEEANFEKMIPRLQLDEGEKLDKATSLLKVPPDRETTLGILERRVGNEEKIGERIEESMEEQDV